MQSQLALGVSNMGKVINILLSSNNETEKTMLATLSDSGKILTDVFHKISLNPASNEFIGKSFGKQK